MPIPVDPTSFDRLLEALRALVREMDPSRDYRGIFEYQVTAIAADGSTADAQPTDPALSLPSILRIPLRSGLLGESAYLTAGSLCQVAFINADPSRPIIVGADVPVIATMDATEGAHVGPSSEWVAIAGGSSPLVPSPWATALAAALTTFSSACQGSTVDSVLKAAAIAFSTALAALPSSATSKTTAT